MQILTGLQQRVIFDIVSAKLSILVPILQACLYSLKKDRVERLGGADSITLYDLAREFREGCGDAGISFEYAVHHSIKSRNDLIYPLVCDVLDSFCGIQGHKQSILFGPEKNGRIPVIETANQCLTNDSVVYVGNRGRPPKLKQYIPQIVKAFGSADERERLPRSIMGLWKTDIFVGSMETQEWVATSVKINHAHLEGAPGLRIGIYPQANQQDCPRLDEGLNLIRLPLKYDNDFMEVFYQAFFLFRAFLKADARVPSPLYLPNSYDRLVAQQLEDRRSFRVVEVMDALRNMSQGESVVNATWTSLQETAVIDESSETIMVSPAEAQGFVSLAPQSIVRSD
jgi:hypothetical protein